MIRSRAAHYGEGQHQIAEADLAGLALDERVRRTFRAPGYTPPILPSVAIELHRLAQSPDVGLDAVLHLLEQDALIAGRVLSRARSAAYAGVSPTTTLRDAILRIGLAAMRDLVWEAALTARVFRAPAFAAQMESVRRHSALAAQLAAAVAKYTPFPSEYAFLCGLLHDVGVAAALIVLSERAGAAPPAPSELALALRATHAEAGKIVTEAWGLPLDVQLAVAAHHGLRTCGHVHPLAAVVALADALAIELGVAIEVGAAPPVEEIGEDELRVAREALELTDKRFALIRTEAAILRAHMS